MPLCLVMSYGTRSRGKQNGPVERFARPGSESSPGAQHGVQAKDDLSGESHHRHQTQRHPLGASVFGYVVRDSKPGETKRSCGAFCPAGERKQSGRAARSASKGRFERRVPPPAPWRVFLQHLRSCEDTCFLFIAIFSLLQGGEVDCVECFSRLHLSVAIAIALSFGIEFT